jgi:hypothetical protein
VDRGGGPCGSERALGRLETLKSVKSNRTHLILRKLVDLIQRWP